MGNSRSFAISVHMNFHVIDNEFIISPAESAEMAETCTEILSALSAISAGTTPSNQN